MTENIDPDPDAVAGGEVVGIPSLSQGVRAFAGLFTPRPALAAEVKQLPGGIVRILKGSPVQRPWVGRQPPVPQAGPGIPGR